MDRKIAIIDFEAGNIFSVINAFKKVKCEIIIAKKPTDLIGVDKIVLPGVGSFNAIKGNLDSLGFTEYLKKHTEKGGFLLGICIGMQLLFEFGEEGGRTSGLGLVKGCVVPFNSIDGYRVPHMGWNDVCDQGGYGLLESMKIKQGTSFYFVHSFHAVLDEDIPHFTCNYCNENVLSGFKKGNILGYQFHPEKSQRAGIELIRDFINL